MKSILEPNYKTPEERAELKRMKNRLWHRQAEVKKLVRMGFCKDCIIKVCGNVD